MRARRGWSLKQRTMASAVVAFVVGVLFALLVLSISSLGRGLW